MGDILHALPAVTALRQAHPDWHLAWAVEPHWAPLLPSSLIDTIHLVPTKAWKQRPFSVTTLREIAELRRTLRAPRYDLAVDLQGSIRSALIGRLAAASCFFGPEAPREPQARLLYRTRVPLHQPQVIQQAAELLSAAAGTQLTPAQVTLTPSRAAQTWFEAEIRTPGFVLLCPTAGWGAKQWPLDRYSQLTTQLRAQGHEVRTNSSAGCTIDQLIALTAHAALVIGGDTGPIHLAAAQGVPTLALFGPTDPARNGPDFPGARILTLRHPSSRLDHRRRTQTESGLLQITVNEVLEAAQTLLAHKEATLHA